MTRVNPNDAMRKSLYKKNAGACCVCKKTGVGLNLHHIDGDSSNTIESNLALLCVSDHDAHHRPNAYSTTNHLNLSSDQLLKFKNEWESFVEECQQDHPEVLAVINVFGTEESIVAMKLIFQRTDGKIVFTRTYQLLDGPMSDWIDLALREIARMGKNIKGVVIDKPLSIEYCEGCHGSFDHFINKSMTIKLTKEDWNSESIATIYLNPNQASLAIIMFYKQEAIYTVSMHLCRGDLHIYDGESINETIRYNFFKSRRTQTKKVIKQILKTWNPGTIVIGTGDEDSPTIIPDLDLPIHWECHLPGKQQMFKKKRKRKATHN